MDYIFAIPIATAVALTLSLLSGVLKPRRLIGAKVLVALAMSLTLLALLESAAYRIKNWPIKLEWYGSFAVATVLLLAILVPALVKANGGMPAKVLVGALAAATYVALSLFIGLAVACSNGNCI